MKEKKTFNEVVVELVLMTKGCKDAAITTYTDTRMPKYFFGEKVMKLSTKLVNIGGDYERRCANRSESGSYEAEKPYGKHFVEFPYLLASDKDESTLYLRTYPSNLKPNDAQNVYYIGEREATEEETATINEWYRSRNYNCTKQLQAGIDANNQVICRDYSIDNIISISANGVRLQRRDFEEIRLPEQAFAVAE